MKKPANIQMEVDGADFEEKRKWKLNDSILLDVYIICQKLQYVQVIYKLQHSYL